MKQNVKVLIGVAVVVAVAAGAWAFGDGSLFQGRASRDISTRSRVPVAPVDLSVGGVKVVDTNYNGVPYYRVTVELKSNAPESEWQVLLNGKDYTQYMGWKTVPANTNTDYSFDIMKSIACDGSEAPSISVNLDPNNKITESNEGNNSFSSNIVCSNANSITSISLDGLYQPVSFAGNYVTTPDPMFLLWAKGKDLKNIKSVTFDDPTLKALNVFQYFDDNNSPTDVGLTKSTSSGIKNVTYTDINGLKQTLSFYLKLPMQIEASTITNPVMSGTLSLSNPKITWSNSKTASQYAYINNKFVHSYFYDLAISSSDDFSQQYSSSLNLYSDDACSNYIYAAPDLNMTNSAQGKHWTCNYFTIPGEYLKKLEVGKKYQLTVTAYDTRDYGNGKNVMEWIDSGVVFTVVK